MVVDKRVERSGAKGRPISRVLGTAASWMIMGPATKLRADFEAWVQKNHPHCGSTRVWVGRAQVEKFQAQQLRRSYESEVGVPCAIFLNS
jgi:hypothetical protein